MAQLMALWVQRHCTTFVYMNAMAVCARCCYVGDLHPHATVVRSFLMQRYSELVYCTVYAHHTCEVRRNWPTFAAGWWGEHQQWPVMTKTKQQHISAELGGGIYEQIVDGYDVCVPLHGNDTIALFSVCGSHSHGLTIKEWNIWSKELLSIFSQCSMCCGDSNATTIQCAVFISISSKCEMEAEKRKASRSWRRSRSRKIE